MAQMTLATRLAGEVCTRLGMPFSSNHTLYRRLRKLLQSGLIGRYPILFSGEYAYHLTRAGAELLAVEEGIEVPTRATVPVAEALQRHEFCLSQFWVKFFGDCRSLKISIVDFYRDGQFVWNAKGKEWVPDGVVIIRTNKRTRALFVEMDRSTQSSGVGGREEAAVRQKFLRYQMLNGNFRKEAVLNSRRVQAVRLVVVCLSEERLINLCRIAAEMGFTKQVVFTCWPRITETHQPNNAMGWNYKNANLLAAPIFTFPIRSPPRAMLS